MIKQLLVLSFLTLCGFVTTTVARADVISEFNFDGGSAVSTDTFLGSTTSDYDPRTAAIGDGGSDSLLSAATGTAFVRSDSTPGTTNPSTSAVYHEFSMTVDNLAVGQTLNLTSIDLDYFATSISGTFFLGVYSDAVGYTGVGDKLGTTNITTNAGDSFVIDLTSTNAVAGTNFTSLTNGDVVEFRFQFGDNVNGNNRIHRLDNIVLNGTVTAVPEPSSFALLGLSGLVVSIRRHRNRRHG